jgi:hypothetical protein
MCAGNATDCIYREYFDSFRGGVLGTPVDKMKLHNCTRMDIQKKWHILLTCQLAIYLEINFLYSWFACGKMYVILAGI